MVKYFIQFRMVLLFDNGLYYMLIFSENDDILTKVSYYSDNKSKLSVLWQYDEHGVWIYYDGYWIESRINEICNIYYLIYSILC